MLFLFLAWYQRSYFNLNIGGFFKFIVNNVIISTLILIFIYFNVPSFCFSLKGVNAQPLVELFHNNQIYLHQKNIPVNIVIESIENARFNLLKQKTVNFNIVKYYNVKNNFLFEYNSKSYTAHPNLYVGCFNNLTFNMQFSHSKDLKYFNFINNKDLMDDGLKQYFRSIIHIQESFESVPLFLNQNALELNDNLLNFNNGFEVRNSIEKPEEVQNFLNNFDDYFNKILKDKL